ncbi:FAD-dependent oxidoreductase [uncultured Clostridium sp.]|uniref:FAD-dependent oxidoreductase n=1 Tax=uncultured Clostridium sp. TaxID=59620 RepID=UPI0025FDC298|nr:FAD-dependent oxidoreductase [uncultured Clostridium sp.]MDU4883684.1 FAD-dependent oxidoreductase [Clostridium celatum]MDU7076577.1 FAD-dependent oxidoreductase [Clostridium celatum]
MEKIYDLLVIGAGPAGLSTGIYAGRAKLNTLIIEKAEFGGQVNKTYDISNYPGARNSNGPKLMEEMRKQAGDFGVNFMSAEVLEVSLEGDVKTLKTDRGEIKGRSVVIATGASPRKLGFKGEDEFTGRGVAYCSTCDGQFFEGLEVFVIGAGFAAAEEAMFLTKFATKVTVIAREPEFTCAKSIADKVLAHPKVEVKFNTEILEANGTEMINYAKFINNKTGETFEYHAKKEDGSFGIFVFVGYAPQSQLFKGILELDKFGYIVTNENMETNIQGVYVAGDLRPKALRQIVTAVSDGAIAATSAERYVIKLKEKLGIKDEYESKKVEKKEVKSSDLNNVSKRSKLLNDGLRAQLKGVLARLEKNVTLVSIVDESNSKSIELRDLILDIADLDERVNAEVYNKGENVEVENKIHADKYPVVALLDSDNKYSGVKFHGVPGGHELNSFILAIYNLGSAGQQISEETLNNIKKIDKDINIKVCVSLSCHLCPDVVVSSQRIAIGNEKVEAEMIDISNFKEIKDKFKVMSVPAIIVNDEQIYFGAKKIDEIINLIK